LLLTKFSRSSKTRHFKSNFEFVINKI